MVLCLLHSLHVPQPRSCSISKPGIWCNLKKQRPRDVGESILLEVSRMWVCRMLDGKAHSVSYSHETFDQMMSQVHFQTGLMYKKPTWECKHKEFVFNSTSPLTCLTIHPCQEWHQHKGRVRKHGSDQGQGRKNTIFLFPSERVLRRLQEEHHVLIRPQVSTGK